MRDSHRAEAERLLERVVAEEVPGSGGRTGTEELLARGLASLDSVAAGAAGEYAAYLRAVEEAEAGTRPAAGLRGGALAGGPALVAGVAAVAAVGADLALGTTTGTALGAGAVVAVAGAAVTVLRATSGRGATAGTGGAGAVEPAGTGAVAPGGASGPGARVEEARLRWLAALEARGCGPSWSGSGRSSWGAAARNARASGTRNPRRSRAGTGRGRGPAGRSGPSAVRPPCGPSGCGVPIAARRHGAGPYWSGPSAIFRTPAGASRDDGRNWPGSRGGSRRAGRRRRPGRRWSCCTASRGPGARRSRCGPRTRCATSSAARAWWICGETSRPGRGRTANGRSRPGRRCSICSTGWAPLVSGCCSGRAPRRTNRCAG